MRGILNINELALRLRRENGDFSVPATGTAVTFALQGGDGFVEVRYRPSDKGVRDNYLAKETRPAYTQVKTSPFLAIDKRDAVDDVVIKAEVNLNGDRRRALVEGPVEVVTPDLLAAVRGLVSAQVETNEAKAEAEKQAKVEKLKAELKELGVGVAFLSGTVGHFRGRGLGLGFRFASDAVASVLKQAPAPKKPTVKPLALEYLSTWDFKSAYFERLDGLKATVVGQCYNDKGQVAQTKRLHNMALLVAEPDNPVDREAVMVFMWDDGARKWAHVGYVPAVEAPLIRSKWTGDYKKCAVARITRQPGAAATGHRVDPRIEVELTGEVRTYPDYEKAARAVGL